jgi:hypothetical protein
VRRLLCILALFAGMAQAQFLGYVAAQTSFQTVFTNQAANGNSATVPNIGQSSHFLSYCTSGFVGTINLQGSPDGTFVSPVTMASANFVSANTSCKILQAGGYQNAVRASVTNYSAGSVSAWYNGTASPIVFTPAGFSTVGPTAPTTCDQAVAPQVAQSTTVTIFGGGGFSNKNIYLCGFTMSFSAATTTGTLTLEYGTGTNCATGTTILWSAYVTASTPQTYVVTAPLGTWIAPGGASVCLATGAITASTTIAGLFAQF